MVYAPRVELYKDRPQEPGYFKPSSPPVSCSGDLPAADTLQVIKGYFRWIWQTFIEYWEELSFRSDKVEARDEM
jgi:hypothetical protein